MAKAVTGAGKTGEPTTPKEFAETTPTQVGPDMTTWLLNAVSKNTETFHVL
jgi:hypothetical protein